MNVEKLLNRPFLKALEKAARVAARVSPDKHNSDIVVSWMLQKLTGRKNILFPVHYIEFLNGCIKKHNLRIREVKSDTDTSGDIYNRRFSVLLNELRNIPPIEFSIAERIVFFADSCRGNTQPIQIGDWISDMGSHFAITSSSWKKGRILTTIVHLTKSRRCLELGTAYGMSAMFIIEALKKNSPNIHLTTLEGWETLYSISSEILKRRYGNQVSCKLGSTYEALPKIIRSFEEPLDFLFHDAGHSKEDFISDFHTVLPCLAPGAVVLIDDIRWEGLRFYERNPRCYEGWMELLNHPRVRRAVEIDESMGLLLLGE